MGCRTSGGRAGIGEGQADMAGDGENNEAANEGVHGEPRETTRRGASAALSWFMERSAPSPAVKRANVYIRLTLLSRSYRRLFCPLYRAV